MSATSALASTTTVTLPRRSGDRVRLGPHERGLRRPRHHPLALSAAPADRVPGEPAPDQGQRRAAALPVARRPPRPQRGDDAAPRPLDARTCASPDAPCDLCSPYSKCRQHLSGQRETDTAGQGSPNLPVQQPHKLPPLPATQRLQQHLDQTLNLDFRVSFGSRLPHSLLSAYVPMRLVGHPSAGSSWCRGPTRTDRCWQAA